jgi:hypothetical protein
MSTRQPLTFDRCRKRLQKQAKPLIFSGLGASTKDHSLKAASVKKFGAPEPNRKILT